MNDDQKLSHFKSLLSKETDFNIKSELRNKINSIERKKEKQKLDEKRLKEKLKKKCPVKAIKFKDIEKCQKLGDF